MSLDELWNGTLILAMDKVAPNHLLQPLWLHRSLVYREAEVAEMPDLVIRVKVA